MVPSTTSAPRISLAPLKKALAPLKKAKGEPRSSAVMDQSPSHVPLTHNFLQNPRFVQGFLHTSCVNPPKRAFRTRLPPKAKRKHQSPIRARSAHIKQPCQAVLRFQPLQTTPAHTPIPLSRRRAPPPQLTIPCARHENLHVHASNMHKVLRLPQNVISARPRYLTIPCACHFQTSKPAQSTAPAMKSENIISCELQQNLHHTTRLD